MSDSITVKDFEQAARRLHGIVHQIPLSSSNTFSKMSGTELYLKYENQQKTGSFKVRGAYNKIAKLLETQTIDTVIASSAGNHAQGVAFAAAALNLKSVIVMPRATPIAKIAATEGYGAEVVLSGDCYDDAYAKAMEIKEKTGAVFIHPFDDPDVIAGQGTISLEILRELPMVDVMVVPAGGGGLLAGISYYVKQINPGVKIVGVQAQGADAIVQSFEKKERVSTDSVLTIADGIAVKSPGSLTVDLINQYVDQMVTVSDAQIAEAILLLLERSKQVVEPAGAASLAAVLNRKIDVEGKRVACVLSGGNIDVSFIHKIVEKGLITRGRQMKFRTVMLDVPGSLEHFSRILAKENANIILIQYDRLQADLQLNEAILHVACEVSSAEHGAALVRRLQKENYKVTMES
ncbi:MAG: threonine ammonia-lyase [Clostridiales bacterium]|nr:threonine ammonia-lyase [Clostridiales bacterium]